MVSINNPSRDGFNIKSVIKGQKPSCKVVFMRWAYPEIVGIEASGLTTSGSFSKNQAVQNKAGTSEPNYLIIDNDIVRCQITKNKNQSSSQFTLVLRRGNKEKAGQVVVGEPLDYLELINSGDWVSIYMKRDGVIPVGSKAGATMNKDSGLKFLGIVENVRYIEIDDPDVGRPRLEYVISGKCFGKVFENEIYYNPVLQSLGGIQEFLGVDFMKSSEKALGGTEAKKSPDQIIRGLIDFYLGAGGGRSISSANKTWFVPRTVNKIINNIDSSGQFRSILDISRINTLYGKTINFTLPSQGTVWEILKLFSNPVLNEMIVDLTIKGNKLVPSFVIRQAPFSNKRTSKLNVFNRSPHPELSGSVASASLNYFTDLPKHTIKSTDIKQKNIGKSDFERVNAITVVPNIPIGQNGDELTAAYTMALNIPSIQRHGLRLLQANTFYTEDTVDTFKKTSTKITAILTDWFMEAHMLYNGTIITDGTNEFVEVGTNLWISDVGQLFHIEGITYLFEVDSFTGKTIYNTEFRVSRGQRTIDPAAAITTFIGETNATSSEETIVTTTLENFRNEDGT